MLMISIIVDLTDIQVSIILLVVSIAVAPILIHKVWVLASANL